MKNPFKNFWDTMLFRDLAKNQSYTRKLNPLMGGLGFLGFLGCLGFLDLGNEIPFAFIFFAFFAFFGFYFESKMSGILMDERYLYNRAKADAISSKIFMLIVYGSTVLVVSLSNNIMVVTELLIAIIELSFGISGVLGHYLLYKFDKGE